MLLFFFPWWCSRHWALTSSNLLLQQSQSPATILGAQHFFSSVRDRLSFAPVFDNRSYYRFVYRKFTLSLNQLGLYAGFERTECPVIHQNCIAYLLGHIIFVTYSAVQLVEISVNPNAVISDNPILIPSPLVLISIILVFSH